MSAAFAYLLEVLVGLGTFLFLARFLLQACRVDFYNPISQGIVRLTDPVLKPARLVLRGYRNIDFAAFLAALVVQFLALLLVSGMDLGMTALLLGHATVKTIVFMIAIIRWSIIIVAIASLVAPGSDHPALRLLDQLVEPVLAPARRILPPMGGFDLSPLIALVVLYMLELILPDLFGRFVGLFL